MKISKKYAALLLSFTMLAAIVAAPVPVEAGSGSIQDDRASRLSLGYIDEPMGETVRSAAYLAEIAHQTPHRLITFLYTFLSCYA